MFIFLSGNRRVLPIGTGYTDCSEDPYWDDVVLLMHFDDLDSNQNFIDETGKIVTKFGNALVTADQAKFGGKAGYFDGTGDYLTLPASEDFAFGTGDFTIEFWVYPNTNNPNMQDICSQAVSNGLQIFFVSGKLRYNNAYVVNILDTTTTFSANQWYHIALVRSNGIASWFVNGVLESSVADATNWTVATGFSLGGFGASQYFTGYIDELRITKGVARYSSNPTKLLCHFDEMTTIPTQTLFGSWDVTDGRYNTSGASGMNFGEVIPKNEKKYFEFTFWQTGSPFYILLEIFPDGLTSSSANYILTDNPTKSGCYIGSVFGVRRRPTDLSGPLDDSGFAMSSGERIGVAVDIANHTFTVTNINRGTTFTYTDMFDSTVDHSIYVTYTTGNDVQFYWGYSSDPFTGTMPVGYNKMSGVNWPNGTYTTSTTGILKLEDDTGKTLTSYGNFAVTDTQSKFGGYSGYFDGTGDYLSIPATTDFAFGTEDFTIEFWAWKSDNGVQGYDAVMSTMTTHTNGGGGWVLELSSSRGFLLYSVGVIIILVDNSICNVNDSQWHHWAVQRQSNQVSLFKDGTIIGTSTNATNIPANGLDGFVTIGTQINTSTKVSVYPFNGYIDELRITKGIAHYTENFTPPTEPFTYEGNSISDSNPIPPVASFPSCRTVA